jgi:hypothetical protein
MTKRAIYILLLICLNPSFAQDRSKASKKIVNPIDSNYFCLVQNHRGFYFPVKVNEKLIELTRTGSSVEISINGAVKDTIHDEDYRIDLDYTDFQFVSNNKAYLVGYNTKLNHIDAPNFGYRLYEYDVEREYLQIKIDSCSKIMDIINGKVYLLHHFKSIMTIDLTTQKNEIILNLENSICSDCSIVDIGFYRNKNVLLINTAKVLGVVTDDDKFFTYNLNNKVLKDVTERLLTTCSQRENDWNQYDYYIDANRSRAFPELLLITRSNCIGHSDYFFIDENIKIVSDLLTRFTTLKGFIYKGDVVLGYFLNTGSDRMKWAGIADFPSLQLENCFYKIFNNVLLKEEELKNLNKYEIDLLEKFVYAKHNYKFNEEYYQFYFNTFSFYSEFDKRKTRIAEVKDLLTETDFKNLLLISKY